MLTANLMPILTDEEELELLGLTNDTKPCPWTFYIHKFGFVCDTICANREKLKIAFMDYLAEREHKKYKREYPDEN